MQKHNERDYDRKREAESSAMRSQESPRRSLDRSMLSPASSPWPSNPVDDHPPPSPPQPQPHYTPPPSSIDRSIDRSDILRKQVADRDDELVNQLVERMKRAETAIGAYREETAWKVKQDEAERQAIVNDIKSREEANHAVHQESSRRQSAIATETARLGGAVDRLAAGLTATEATVGQRFGSVETALNAVNKVAHHADERSQQLVAMLTDYRQHTDSRIQELEATVYGLTEGLRESRREVASLAEELRRAMGEMAALLNTHVDGIRRHIDGRLSNVDDRIEQESSERARNGEETRAALEMQAKFLSERMQQERGATHARFISMEKAMTESSREFSVSLERVRLESDTRSRSLDTRLVELANGRVEAERGLRTDFTEATRAVSESVRQVRDEGARRHTELEDVIRVEIKGRLVDQTAIKAGIDTTRSEISSQSDMLTAQLHSLEASEAAAHELIKRAVKEDVQFIQEESARATSDLDAVVQQLKQRVRMGEQARVKEEEEIRVEAVTSRSEVDSAVDALRREMSEGINRVDEGRREAAAMLSQLDERLQHLKAEIDAKADVEVMARSGLDAAVRRELRGKVSQDALDRLQEASTTDQRHFDVRLREVENTGAVREQSLTLLKAEVETKLQAEARARLDASLAIKRDVIRLEQLVKSLDRQGTIDLFKHEMGSVLPELVHEAEKTPPSPQPPQEEASQDTPFFSPEAAVEEEEEEVIIEEEEEEEEEEQPVVPTPVQNVAIDGATQTPPTTEEGGTQTIPKKVKKKKVVKGKRKSATATPKRK